MSNNNGIFGFIMKPHYLFLNTLSILLLQFAFSSLQAQPFSWQNTIGGSQNEFVKSTVGTSDGGYIFAGYSSSTISPDKSENNIGGYDMWIVKTDSVGNIEWDNTIGGLADDAANSIVQTFDGGYVVAGYSGSGISGDKTEASNGGNDFWIVKFTPENLGISESEQKTSITLYPNPVKNELTVKLDFYMPSQKISISDVHGKTILTQDAEDLITTINTSTLSQGTYFLTVQNLGEKTTQKFIVE